MLCGDFLGIKSISTSRLPDDLHKSSQSCSHARIAALSTGQTEFEQRASLLAYPPLRTSRTAAMTSSHRLDLSVEKPYVEQKEDIEHGGRRRQSSTRHGDRALAIIGDDRISLTDEDVRCKRFT
jgi:hypothetical protein